MCVRTSDLTPSDRVTLLGHVLLLFQRAILDLCHKDVLISFRHLNGNHWTAVAIANRSKEFFFLDSARTPYDARLVAAHQQEQSRAVERFNLWAKRWNESHDANHQFGTHYQRIATRVQQQEDGNTCGIWSMVVSIQELSQVGKKLTQT